MKGKRVLKKQRSESNRSLLGTYFISLFSVLLCFVMLLGTTFAWFYTDNTSMGNEIHSGILKVDMLHDGTSLAEQPGHAVFSNDLWTPDRYSQTETVEIINAGNVMLDYKLDFVPQWDFDHQTAALFDVYVNQNETPVGSLDDFLSDAEDKTDNICLAEWQGLVPRDRDDAPHFIEIELRMDTAGAHGAMDQSVPLYLKLEACQHLTGTSE